MRVKLLHIDLDELGELGLDPQEAFTRGSVAVGKRATHERLQAQPHSDSGLAELVDLFAERSADMRLVRFSLATKEPEYERSARAYDRVEDHLQVLRRDVAPRSRARLRQLRAREAELERALVARGIDPRSIGPLVPEGEAIDPSPKPGEGPHERRIFPPLPPRRSLLSRLLRAARR